MNNLFPFTIKCRDYGNFVYYPKNYLKYLLQKKECKGWYCYDVIVNSPTNVTFVAFSMKDFYGGIGEEIYRVSVDVPLEVTLQDIKEEALVFAENKRLLELQESERLIVERYAKEILNEALNIEEEP